MKTMRDLDDGTVVLRPYRLGDVGDLYEAARESVDQVHPWLPWCHPGFSKAEGEVWIRTQHDKWQTGEEFQFVIRDATSQRFLGGCGLNHVNRVHRFANLGYWVRTSECGRGFASRAAHLAAQYGLRELGLLRIEIVVALGNHGSHRVAEKLGAFKEGVLRNRLFVHGEAHDAVMYSVVPPRRR
jgi:ribosomal-protein-serine acetyltransferase